MHTGGSPGSPLILLAYVGDPTPAVDANIEFIGWAVTGSPTGNPVWRIAKLFYDGMGNLTAIRWADPERRYISVWDNRTALVYT